MLILINWKISRLGTWLAWSSRCACSAVRRQSSWCVWDAEALPLLLLLRLRRSSSILSRLQCSIISLLSSWKARQSFSSLAQFSRSWVRSAVTTTSSLCSRPFSTITFSSSALSRSADSAFDSSAVCSSISRWDNSSRSCRFSVSSSSAVFSAEALSASAPEVVNN